MFLDLGCGQVGPKEGYEGVDLFEYEGTSWICDLEKTPWVFHKANDYIPPAPMPDNWVEGIHCAHLVEHVRDLVAFMGEMWRVCKDGAIVNISHPYQFNVRAWQDPTHVRCLNEISFFYFDKSWRQERNEFGSETDFAVEDIIAIPEGTWEIVSKEKPEEFERACRNQINVISDLQVVLRCRK
jgi:SAM-dependent methyltransferase